MKRNPGSGDLSCLHGIRVLSTCWVVIGHTFTRGVGASHNLHMIIDQGKTWWFQGIGNATVSVDTFLVMSGMLVAYLLLQQLDKSKGKINVAMLYLHRFLR